MDASKPDEECDTCDLLRRMTRTATAHMRLRHATVAARGASSGSPAPLPTPAAGSAAAAPGAEAFFAGGFWPREPPADLVQLGQAGWTLLHTIAAYYPDSADPARREQTHAFLRLFAKVAALC